MARDHRYIYLCYGPSPQTQRELRYSFETLLPEIGGDDCARLRIHRPARGFPRFIRRDGRLFGGPRRARGGQAYHHRVKPLALARALRLYNSACALIDTDSFIREGFTRG